MWERTKMLRQPRWRSLTAHPKDVCSICRIFSHSLYARRFKSLSKCKRVIQSITRVVRRLTFWLSPPSPLPPERKSFYCHSLQPQGFLTLTSIPTTFPGGSRTRQWNAPIANKLYLGIPLLLDFFSFEFFSLLAPLGNWSCFFSTDVYKILMDVRHWSCQLLFIYFPMRNKMIDDWEFASLNDSCDYWQNKFCLITWKEHFNFQSSWKYFFCERIDFSRTVVHTFIFINFQQYVSFSFALSFHRQRSKEFFPFLLALAWREINEKREVGLKLEEIMYLGKLACGVWNERKDWLMTSTPFPLFSPSAAWVKEAKVKNVALPLYTRSPAFSSSHKTRKDYRLQRQKPYLTQRDF